MIINFILLFCKVRNKSIDKILSKIDALLRGQKDIENRIANIEKILDNSNSKTNNSIDPNYVKVIKCVCIRRKLMQTYDSKFMICLT